MTFPEKYIMDSREKNKTFHDIAEKEDEDGVCIWSTERLTTAYFMPILEGVYEIDCGDMTNGAREGIVEFKEFGDMVGSTTRDGVYHLEEQCCKMYSTGLPASVIVHGSRQVFQRKSKVGDELILDAYQKLVTILSVYKITCVRVDTPEEAIEVAKTFLRKCRELPRRMPIYNLFKKTEDYAIAVLCGYLDIGPVVASNILIEYGSHDVFFSTLHELLEKHSPKKAAKIISKNVDKFGEKKAMKIIEIYKKDHGETI
jgi:ERCC4-type nuclease